MEYAKLQHKCCLKIWSFRQMNKSQHKLRTRWKSAQKMWRCMNPKNKTWSIWLQILIRMLQNFLLSHEIYFWFYICNQIMRNTRKTGDWFENLIYIHTWAVGTMLKESLWKCRICLAISRTAVEPPESTDPDINIVRTPPIKIKESAKSVHNNLDFPRSM